AASDAAIDVTMSCVDGQLTTVIDSKLADADTQRFAAALEASLQALIAHTTAVTRSGSRAAMGTIATGPHDSFVPYLVVHDDAPGPTLFMLPPGEGGAESYLSSLARQLPGARLVIFNNLHLHTPGASFEALAAYYVEHIQRIQPRGPYHLLGWSFGGVLALEIANQLAGAPIENLLLIDPYFNVAKAVAEIGLPAVDDLLDPINYRYRPSRADLERLAERVENVVVFKAGVPNEVVTSEDQRRLFAHYHGTRDNHLDTLLPGDAIRVEVLDGQSHHSWVRDHAAVHAMGRRIGALLEPT
ncbi:MAG: alpha/beta fold hydrolase, partial [Myxococcales bacterium]|nr:alpha/beta fold hydrolase [Myxococcales bacterium]